MSKSSKLAQSALRKRVWSIPSATQEPRSSQLISPPEQPAATKLADPEESEQRPKNIQDALVMLQLNLSVRIHLKNQHRTYSPAK